MCTDSSKPPFWTVETTLHADDCVIRPSDAVRHEVAISHYGPDACRVRVEGECTGPLLECDEGAKSWREERVIRPPRRAFIPKANPAIFGGMITLPAGAAVPAGGSREEIRIRLRRGGESAKKLDALEPLYVHPNLRR